MAMATHIIASSPTITKSHLVSSPPLQSWKRNLSSSRNSPYTGLKHLGLTVSPKSPTPERKRRCSKGMVIRASLFGVGAPEALVIGVVALLVFGPKGLAEVARNLGKTLRAFQPTIRELQDVSRDFKTTLEREIGLDVPPQVPRTEDPLTATDSNDAQSPKAYTTEDYLKITEEQLKASSPGESQDQTQTQEPIQTPNRESLPNGTTRDTTSAAPPRQD